MRSDLETALDLQHGRGPTLRGNGYYKKAIAAIDEFLDPQEHVLAIVGLIETTGAVWSLVSRAAPVLLLTELAVYSVYPKTVVGSEGYARVPLDAVHEEPRAYSGRGSDWQGKAHVLYLDELRGGNVETHAFRVDNEKILEFIWSEVSRAVAAVHQRARAEAERRADERVEQAAALVQTPPAAPVVTAIADELSKLAGLLDRGVIDADEFADLKSKLMRPQVGTPSSTAIPDAGPGRPNQADSGTERTQHDARESDCHPAERDPVVHATDRHRLEDVLAQTASQLANQQEGIAKQLTSRAHTEFSLHPWLVTAPTEHRGVMSVQRWVVFLAEPTLTVCVHSVAKTWDENQSALAGPQSRPFRL